MKNIHYILFFIFTTQLTLVARKAPLTQNLENLSHHFNNVSKTLKTQQHSSNKISQEIKQALYDKIKADLVTIRYKHMGIMNVSFTKLTQGNKNLENDLQKLYNSFYQKGDIAQERLNRFTIKWQLTPISIQQVIQDYASGTNKIPDELSPTLKKEIADRLKGYIIDVFYNEMGIMTPNVSKLAQGNTILEDDLIQVVKSFNHGQEIAQKNITIFTQKWQLEDINIPDILEKL